MSQPDWSTSIERTDAGAISMMKPELMQPGLTLVSQQKHEGPEIALIDAWAERVHRWDLSEVVTKLKEVSSKKSWFGYTSTYLPEINGLEMLDDGDIVFNFAESLLARMDLCGKIQWALPVSTHHSVFYDRTEQLIWTNLNVPFSEELSSRLNIDVSQSWDSRVIAVDLEGHIKKDFSVFEVLHQSGLDGILYLSSLENWGTQVSGDILHLNHVETFQSTMSSEFFDVGDILISTRNNNSIFVIDPDTMLVKWRMIGPFLRQHDPHFIGGDRLSLFDNFNASAAKGPWDRSEGQWLRSRILEVSASTNQVNDITKEIQFFSPIMGKHSKLVNGNHLVTSSLQGKVFEFSQKHGVVWEYQNILDKVSMGVIFVAKRLSPELNKDFIQRQRSACQ